MHELWSWPYIATKVITKCNYETAFNSDPTRTHFVRRNLFVEYFPRDNKLPNLLSNYDNFQCDDVTEHFFIRYARKQLSQLTPLIDSLVEQQKLNDYYPFFLTHQDHHDWTRHLIWLLKTTTPIRRQTSQRVHHSQEFLSDLLKLFFQCQSNSCSHSIYYFKSFY